jgi:hypothetical protein
MNINEYNETARVLCLFIFIGHTREGNYGRQREGSVYCGQHTDVIEDKPEVKVQSVCAAPGIATGPRSVLQVPIADNVSTVSGGVSASAVLYVSLFHVSGD